MARGKGDPFDTKKMKSMPKQMVGPGPRTGIPPVAPVAPGMGPPPGTRRATTSPLKMKGRPLSAFMPSPKSKRGKKGQKRLAV